MPKLNNELISIKGPIFQQGGLRLQGKIKHSSSDKLLVSIITAVYNGGQFLEQTIQSVLSQTYDNIEYIIIDGGSTDDTLSIIRKYEHRIDYWISEPDKGIADAFNKGIEVSRGEVIGIINADDWYEPDAIMIALQNLGEGDVVYGKLQFWNNNQIDKIVSADHKGLKRQMTMYHPSVFVHRRAYQQWGRFQCEYRIAMDYDLLLRFYLRNARFTYVDKVLANMKRGGISNAGWRKVLDEAAIIKKSYGLPPLHVFLHNNLLYVKIRTSQFIEKVGLRPFFLKAKQLLFW